MNLFYALEKKLRDYKDYQDFWSLQVFAFDNIKLRRKYPLITQNLLVVFFCKNTQTN